VCRFATLCESHALYAGGSFGIIQEFYVEPQFRSAGLGRSCLMRLWRMADAWAGNGWKCARRRCLSSTVRWNFIGTTVSKSRVAAR